MQILGHFFGGNFLNHSLSDDNNGKWRKFLYSFYNHSVVDDYGGYGDIIEQELLRLFCCKLLVICVF